MVYNTECSSRSEPHALHHKSKFIYSMLLLLGHTVMCFCTFIVLSPPPCNKKRKVAMSYLLHAESDLALHKYDTLHS